MMGEQPASGDRVIHLDANFMIQAELPGTPAAHAVGEWLRDGVPLRASLVVWAEYLGGAGDEAGIRHWRAVLDGFDPLTESQCQLAASLHRRGRRARTKLADCLIAAGAIERGAALATLNRRDFEGFVDQGLELAMEAWRKLPEPGSSALPRRDR